MVISASNSDLKRINALSTQVRILALEMIHKTGASHIGSCFSCIDILVALYSKFLPVDEYRVNSANRNQLVFSKGHAAAALYATLSVFDYMSVSELDTYCRDGSLIGGHSSFNRDFGIEFSSGSLGHGLPYATGLAYSKKLDKRKGTIFALISDGECDEGTTWESALFASHHSLSNICLFIDRNYLQSLGSTESTLNLEPLREKWLKFGWDCEVVDGHNPVEIINAVKPRVRPLCIIANTIKGKGVPFMENSVAWHYKSPNSKEFDASMESLNKI